MSLPEEDELIPDGGQPEGYDETALRRTASLGDTVRRELQTSYTVRLIVEKADQVKQAALDELCSQPHLETEKLRDLHHQIYQANQIGVWLADAIARGDAAAKELGSPAHPDT